MRARWRRRLGVAAAALTLAACATARVENGVFRAPALFRVTVPGAGWEITAAEPTELGLRHRDSHAGILANAECGEGAVRRDLRVLTRRLFVGLRGRETLAHGPATVGGVPAVHTIVEAQVGRSAERMRMEAYVMKDERCVYDLVYVAPADVFEAQRADFGRLVESFAKE
jgi:hypothetical protein